LTLGFHPYANLFPLIEGKDFYDLAEDIRANGLQDCIDLIEVDGVYQILDGRNRYRALVWLATEGRPLGGVDGWGAWHGEALTAEKIVNVRDLGLYNIWQDAEGALSYVLSKNLNRRHMTDDDRRMVGARLVNLRQGRPSDEKTSQFANISREMAATMATSDVAGIDRARAVIAHAAPDIVAAVDDRRLSVSAAATLAALPAERQAEILQNLPRDDAGKLTPEVKKALAPVIKEIRHEKIAAKKERRADREQKQGRRLQELPAKTFGVAIEDFEWDHEAWSKETGVLQHPSMHYETAADAHTPEEIVARCAERFACLADDCILFKWTPVPHLAIAMEVMRLQGFTYVTSLCWNKERPGSARGQGYWFTGEHEIVLVGVRGKVVPPYPAHFRSSFSTPVGEHSEKPPNIHEIVEFHWPTTPKVEFNARRARPGWRTWGFDAPDADEIPESADGFDPAHDATGGVLIPAMVAEQAGESDAGETMMAGASAVPSPALLAPAEPAAVEVGCGQAPETNLPTPRDHDLDIPEFLRRPLKQSELDLTRRDRAEPEVVDGTLQTRLPLTSDEIELQSALCEIDAGREVDWSIMRQLVGAGFVHATTTRLFVTDEGRAFQAQLVGLAAAIEARA